MELIKEKICKIIGEAIIQRKMICFQYQVDENNIKVVNTEPYLIGRNRKNKNILLTAYFIPTTHQAIIEEQKEGWKHYLIANIIGVSILDVPFFPPRQLYNPEPKQMDIVFYSVR